MAENQSEEAPEKRRSVRINKPLAVQFGVMVGSSTTWDMSLIKDISESGICIRTASPLNKNDVCFLRFKMPTHPKLSLEISAKVIESNLSRSNICITRLEFINPDDEQKRLLREYVAWALVNERGGK